ncbi:DUF2637 domain-containing protein [Streptomyces sp. NPDC058572]|uniref:DUF2637 domain-containing protein n=1 Tax=Streptomyces sp. NPDC058572 TaxID=3346546 RepID=UPI00365C3F6E
MRHGQGTARDQEKRGIPELTRVHRLLIGVVVVGAVVIASIGFAGSYAAVQALAVKKGFGDFSYWFPIGIDAGIVVLLGLDLLLTWIRIPFPLLRQTAWLLTAATIAFNGAAAWPDPLGVGMHAVIPVLFVVAVEAARHAVGRIADITADKHMEGVRITRWLLSPVPTFKLWRRMKLWEVRSYEVAVGMEQDRMVYQARLQARFGRAWRRKAPVEAMMPIRLAKYGVPIAKTAPAGLAAAGIEVELERLDIRPELPTVAQQTASEPVNVDMPEHHGQYEVPVEETAGHPEPEPTPAAMAHYEAYGPQLYDHVHGQLAAAASPVAARNDGRPQMVQARIDRADWLRKDLEPVPEVVDEAVDEGLDEVNEGAAPEPDLPGKELLEYRYLQLPPELRAPHQSASALARQWHMDAGFTVNSARKYLGEIINKHK